MKIWKVVCVGVMLSMNVCYIAAEGPHPLHMDDAGVDSILDSPLEHGHLDLDEDKDVADLLGETEELGKGGGGGLLLGSLKCTAKEKDVFEFEGKIFKPTPDHKKKTSELARAQREHAQAVKAHHKAIGEDKIKTKDRLKKTSTSVGKAMERRALAGPVDHFDCKGLQLRRACVERMPLQEKWPFYKLKPGELPSDVDNELSLHAQYSTVCEGMGSIHDLKGQFMQINSTYEISLGFVDKEPCLQTTKETQKKFDAFIKAHSSSAEAKNMQTRTRARSRERPGSTRREVKPIKIYVRTHDCRCFNPKKISPVPTRPFIQRECQDKDDDPGYPCSEQTTETCRRHETIPNNCARTCSNCSSMVDAAQASQHDSGAPYCKDSNGQFIKRFSEWTEAIFDNKTKTTYVISDDRIKDYRDEYSCVVQAIRQKFLSEEQIATGRAITTSSGCTEHNISGISGAEGSNRLGEAGGLRIGRTRGLSPGFRSQVGGWSYAASNRAGNDEFELGEANYEMRMRKRRAMSPLASTGSFMMMSSNRAGNDEELE